MADGGVITEPIIGRGLRSGNNYAFGENTPNENEYITPASKLGGNISVNVYNAPANTQVQTTRSSNGDVNLDIIIDNIMADGSLIVSSRIPSAAEAEKFLGYAYEGKSIDF
jgi:hypothetical protein